jgi:hypothetical protein
VGFALGSALGVPEGAGVGDGVLAVGALVGSAPGVLAGVLAGEPDGVGVGVFACRRAGSEVPPTDPIEVPVASDPPRRLAIGRPSTASTPVSAPKVSAVTATAAAARRSPERRVLVVATGSGAAGSATGASAAVRLHCVTVLWTTARVRCSEREYIALATVAITLATAAPMIVPATPRKDAPNAAAAAATALPTSWLKLMPRRGGVSDAVRTVGGPGLGSWGDMRTSGRGLLSPVERAPDRDGFNPAA